MRAVEKKIGFCLSIPTLTMMLFADVQKHFTIRYMYPDGVDDVPVSDVLSTAGSSFHISVAKHEPYLPSFWMS